MSGRRSGRLAAVTALLALAVFSGGMVELDPGAFLMDFDWGAPVGAISGVAHP